MSDAKRYLTGVVLSEQSGATVPNARVVASRSTATGRIDVGAGSTDSDGRFSLRLEQAAQSSQAGTLRLRVEYSGLELEQAYGSQHVVTLGRGAADRTLWVRMPLGRSIRPPGSVEYEHFVFGSIRHINGSVPTMTGLKVIAFEVRLTGLVRIGPGTGETVTPTSGEYVIPLSESAAGKNIRVVVTKEAGDPGDPGDTRLGASRVHVNAPINPRIDILLTSEESRGDSEFDVISAGVTAATEGSSVSLGSLRSQHLMLISASRGLDAVSLGRYEVAARVRAKLDVPSSLSETNWTEYIFGLISVGFPTTAPELLSRPWASVEPALELARKRGHISAAAAANITNFKTVWNQSKASLAVASGTAHTNGSIAPVLEAAGLSTDSEQKALVKAWLENTGTVANFWTDLPSHPTVGAYASAVQSAFKVAALVDSHGPIISKALTWLDGDPVAGLAELDVAQWETWMTELEGASESPRPSTYASNSAFAAAIIANVESAFPSSRARAAVITGTGIDTALYDAILEDHTALVSFLESDPDIALDGPPPAGDSEGAVKVRQLQRLYRVAPSAGGADVALRLLNFGDFRSARDIAGYGKRRFVQAVQTGAFPLTATQALEVFQKARNLSAMTSVLATMVHPSLRRGFAYGLTEVISAPSGDDAPDVTTLFGSQDTCACEPCLSVYSPAAYLADLLKWVDDREGWSDEAEPPTWALNGRRADLGELALSCENTFRVLPYLDLVNEILEDAVAGLAAPPPPDEGDPGSGSGTYSPPAPSTGRVTTLSAEELLVTPEYRNPTAYERLGSADTAYFSHALPYHLDNAEHRAFLGLLGLDRTALLELGDAPPSALAAEELGLCEADVELITGEQHGARRWGYFGDTTAILGVANFIDDLTSLRTFRDRSGLDLESILELVHCRVANPLLGSPADNGLVVRFDEACSLDDSQIRHTTDPENSAADSTPSRDQLSRLSIFLRVSRALGGSLLHTDRVLHTLGITDAAEIAQASLTALGQVKRLARQLHLDAEIVASFFGDIDTYEDRETATKPQPCLYDRLFMDARRFPDATPTATPESWAFVLNSNRDELELYDTEPLETKPALNDYRVSLAAAFRCSLIDLADAVSWAGDDLKLMLADLSAVHRRVVLSAALRRPVRQVRRLAGLIGPGEGAVDEGWIFTSPANMVAFVDEVRELDKMKADVHSLLYLVAHEAEAVAAQAPGAVASQRMLGELRDALRGLAAEYDQSAEVTTAVQADLEDVLAEVLGVSSLTGLTGASALISVAEGTWYAEPEASEGDRDAQWEALLAALEADAVSRPLLNLLDLWDLRAQLIGASPPDEVLPETDRLLNASSGERFSWLINNLRWGSFRSDHREDLRAAAATRLTDLLGRKGRFANRVRELELSVAWPPASDHASFDYECVDAFLTRGFLAFETADADRPNDDIVDSDAVAPDAMAGAFDAFAGLHKAARYFTLLDANEDEEEAAITEAGALGLPDPGAFPAASSDDPREGYQELRAALRLFATAARLPGSAPTTAELLPLLGDGSALATALAERTGWDADELSALVASDWYTLGSQGPVEDLRRLVDAVALRDKAGIDATRALLWLTVPEEAVIVDATTEQAVSARDAASAQAGDPSAWVAAARPVRDALRERQRTALLAWLIDRADSPFDDPDSVYEYYLIDVSMGSWLTTSRVQLALASVQLYVQRHLMGLETVPAAPDGVHFSDDDHDEWQWMKNYRVWEAARKVFLYPENWTDPELRDDETPFYEDLRSDLSQGDLDDDHVEEAALSYLEKLRQVHAMKILSYTCQQETVDDEDIDVVHVLARTRARPYEYYYRRREDESTWTPWEQVDVGVESDNVLLVVYARRLMLFWLTFEEKGSTDSDGDEKEWYDIRLNWSERKNDAWTPRQTSNDTLDTHDDTLDTGSDPDWMHLEKHCYSLYATETDSGKLRVKVLVRELNYRIRQFTMDPCTMYATIGTSSELIDESDAKGQEPWYQGYRSIDAEALAHDEPENGPYTLNTLDGTSLLTDSSDRIYHMVCRDDLSFDYDSLFFAELDRRPYLVLPKSPVSDISKLAGTTNTLSLGDLGHFSSLGEDTDPASGDEPDTDLEFTGMAGALTGTSLETTLTRSYKYKGNPINVGLRRWYEYEPFHHPYVCTFMKEVRLNGIFGLLNPSEAGDASDLARQQLQEVASDDNFDDRYVADENATISPAPYPYDQIDFASGGAYSLYNWELFFHLPWLVASRLRADQRYEESLDWLHCIFDPRSQNTSYPIPKRFWKFKPFMTAADADPSDWGAFTGEATDDTTQYRSFERQVAAWQADPFNPHLLARLRAGTYPKAIFMSYLDTLIAWGDHLFEQDTRESLQEATQLYVLAGHLLGDRPVTLPSAERPDPSTYLDLRSSLDSMSNALVSLENSLPVPSGFAVGGRFRRGLRKSLVGTSSVAMYPVFCVPPNPRLLAYWDTVEDRLYKIRNGLNLAGERRSLDLFAPPIDPGALVAARAGGLGLQSAVAATSPTLPNHRFSVMHGRAMALTGSVRALGGALLSALEKRDAEALSLLRQGHEQKLLERVEQIKELAVDEASAAVDALTRSEETTQARLDYYQGLIDNHWNGWEVTQVTLSSAALALTAIPAGLYTLKSFVGLIPQIHLGVCAGTDQGGEQASKALDGAAQALNSSAGALSSAASLAATVGAFQRRAEEWAQQVSQAELELAQLAAQKVGANARLDMAKRELKNHQLQREQSAEVERWLRSKYTNQDLYQWMCTTTAGLYFSTYKLAVDLARQAELCYRYELGVDSSSYIQYGHWDSLKKGLMAGERLGADLERLDAAYLAGDARELELVKHVSVAQLDPFALVALQTSGECWVDLPEAIFDLDCPGHYFRRLQAVTLSVACVSGPQANVNLELTLHSSKVRREADTSAELVSDPDVGVTQIVTSSARDDGGLFQLDLRDPRYLPFERRGAISTWRVRMCNTTLRQIDWSSITDVTLHLRYTALSDDGLRSDVLLAQASGPADYSGGYGLGADDPGTAESEGLVVASSARRDQPDAWYAAREASASSLTFTLGSGLLPAFATAPGATVALSRVHVLVVDAAPSAGSTTVPVGGDTASLAFSAWGSTGAVLAKTSTFSADPWPADLTVSLTGVTMDEVGDVIVMLEYTVTVS